MNIVLPLRYEVIEGEKQDSATKVDNLIAETSNNLKLNKGNKKGQEQEIKEFKERMESIIEKSKDNLEKFYKLFGFKGTVENSETKLQKKIINLQKQNIPEDQWRRGIREIQISLQKSIKKEKEEGQNNFLKNLTITDFSNLSNKTKTDLLKRIGLESIDFSQATIIEKNGKKIFQRDVKKKSTKIGRPFSVTLEISKNHSSGDRALIQAIISDLTKTGKNKFVGNLTMDQVSVYDLLVKDADKIEVGPFRTARNLFKSVVLNKFSCLEDENLLLEIMDDILGVNSTEEEDIKARKILIQGANAANHIKGLLGEIFATYYFSLLLGKRASVKWIGGKGGNKKPHADIIIKETLRKKARLFGVQVKTGYNKGDIDFQKFNSNKKSSSTLDQYNFDYDDNLIEEVIKQESDRKLFQAVVQMKALYNFNVLTEKDGKEYKLQTENEENNPFFEARKDIENGREDAELKEKLFIEQLIHGQNIESLRREEDLEEAAKQFNTIYFIHSSSGIKFVSSYSILKANYEQKIDRLKAMLQVQPSIKSKGKGKGKEKWIHGNIIDYYNLGEKEMRLNMVTTVHF